MIKIRSLLGDLGVPFWTTGKNVSEGWTAITCPICGDRSNHGGFPPDDPKYSCFRCGKHSTVKIINAFVGDWNKSKALIAEYTDILQFEGSSERERAGIVEWPPKISTLELPSLHAQYLHDRGYNPQQIRDAYGVLAQYQSGDFKYRLLIPVYLNHRIMTYVGRDVTGRSPLRYKNLAETRSVLPAKECVYNIDSTHETAIICEGIFDAWRFGTQGVALFGIQFTTNQTNLLARRLKRAFICFDSEYVAQQKANELGETLSMQGVDVEILLLDRGDPGDMTQEEADEVKRELLL